MKQLHNLLDTAISNGNEDLEVKLNKFYTV
jgi:hypothetical protein